MLEARPIYDLLGHKGAVTAVRFSPKGDFIASGESENMVFVWKTNFDIADKQLGIVPPSTNKHYKNESNEAPYIKENPQKAKSILKEQCSVQNKLGSLTLNKNKENNFTDERISIEKVI